MFILLLKTIFRSNTLHLFSWNFYKFLVTSFMLCFVVGLVEGESWFAERPGLCNSVALICLTACFCSLNSIGAVSFNRYIHICHYSLYKKVFTRTKCTLFCVGLWVYSFLLESPNLLGWGGHIYDQKILTCLWDRTSTYSLFMPICGIFIPSAVIGASYLRIYLYVKESRKQISGRKQSRYKQKREKESVKLAMTLFIIFATFVVCWMPYAIVILADTYDTFSAEVHMFTLLIAHTNSSINSVLYGVFNRNFRNAYFRLLRLDKWFVNFCKVRKMESSGISRDEDINCSLPKHSSSESQNKSVELAGISNGTGKFTFIPGITPD